MSKNMYIHNTIEKKHEFFVQNNSQHLLVRFIENSSGNDNAYKRINFFHGLESVHAAYVIAFFGV